MQNRYHTVPTVTRRASAVIGIVMAIVLIPIASLRDAGKAFFKELRYGVAERTSLITVFVKETW